MDPGGGGAFGGSMAGAAQDPVSFVKKPTVMIRIACLIFGIVVFGSISSQGWSYDSAAKKEICIMNNSSATCHFATFVGVMAFIASIGFLAGEWFFEQMSSVKTRKHYVIADMGFSALWAFFYAVAFLVMSVAWSKTSGKFSYSRANIIGAIFFCFCSILTWMGGAFFAYTRYKAGSDTAFTQGIGEEEGFGHEGAQAGNYTEYGEKDGEYSEPPFQGGGQSAMNYQQQVQY